MALVTFACPGCKAVLKSPGAIAAGKKIRCPKCSTTFTVPGGDGAALVQEKLPAPKARVPVPPVEEEDEPVQEEEAEERRPKKRLKAREEPQPDDEEDEEEEERRPKKRLKRKKKKADNLKVTLIVVGIVVGLIGIGLGTYFAIDYFGGVNKGTGNEDPLAYVPANSAMVAQLDCGVLFSQPGLGPVIEQMISSNGPLTILSQAAAANGIPLRDLMNQTTIAVGSGGGPSGPIVTLIVKSKVPFNQKKIVRLYKGPPSFKAGNKTYYSISHPQFPYLFMPSDNIIVLTRSAIEPIVSSDGINPLMDRSLLQQAQSLAANHASVAIPVTGEFQQGMLQGMAGAPVQGVEQKAVLAAFQQCRAMSFAGKLSGGNTELSIDFTFSSAANSRILTSLMQKSLDEMTKGVAGRMQLAAAAAFLPEGLRVPFRELMESLSFEQRGPVAHIGARVSTRTIEILIGMIEDASRTGRFGIGPPGMFGPQ